MTERDTKSIAPTNGGKFGIAVVLAVTVSAASLLLYGFDFGVDNNEFHTVIVYRIARIASFERDAMAATLGSFASPFWFLLGYLARVFDPKALFFVFFLLARFLMTMGMGYLAVGLSGRTVATGSWMLAIIATLSSGFIDELPLGGDPPMGTYLSQTFFSYGLCLLALGAFFDGKNLTSATILGVTYNVNLMQANFVLGIICALSLPQILRREPGGILKFLRYMAVVGIIASPTIVWSYLMFSNGHPGEILTGKALVDFAKFYYPGHYFFLDRTMNVKVAGLALALLPFTMSFSRGARIQNSLRITSFTLFAYVAAEAVMGHLGPTRLFFQLHLLRSDVISYALAVTTACVLIGNLAYEQDRNWALYLPVLVLILLNMFYVVALIMAIFAVTVEHLKEMREHVKSIGEKTAAMFMIIGIAVLSALRPQIKFIPALAVAPILVLAKNWRRLSVGLSVVLIIGVTIPLATNVVQKRDALAQKRYARAELDGFLQAAASILPHDALVAVPPSLIVRAFLKRSVYVNWKEGAAYLWNKGFEVGYLRRLRNIGVHYPPAAFQTVKSMDNDYMKSFFGNAAALKRDGVTHAIIEINSARALDLHGIMVSEKYCLISL